MSVEINENNLKNGLLGLLVALVEVIQEALEAQAIRRMEGGSLNEEEVERLGNAFMELNQALDKLKEENHLEEVVGETRKSLDCVVDDVIDRMVDPGRWAEEEEKNEC